MGFVSALQNWINKHGVKHQDTVPTQGFRDALLESTSYSIEGMTSRTLSNLVTGGYELRVGGTSDRALRLDKTATRFTRFVLNKAVTQSMLFGDAVIVPRWDGRDMQHSVMSSEVFRVLGSRGDELTDLVYITESKIIGTTKYQLLQRMTLEAWDNETYTGNAHMRLYVVQNDGVEVPIGKFPDWAEYDSDWTIPNVHQLPIGRIKSPTVDTRNPNGVYGAPICWGCSAFLSEIRYLLTQEHAEFELSEKSIIADKSMFVSAKDDSLQLPHGRERLYMWSHKAGKNMDKDNAMKEWSPEIQNGPYAEALEDQYRLMEKGIGVDSGILSKPSDESYQNVDNVRKSTRNTQSFVSNYRDIADVAISQLVEAWDTLLNYYGLPTGTFEYRSEWSDDYINTFADQQNALAAGFAMGATDAYDYRTFVLGEPPDVARARIDEIAKNKPEPQMVAV
ncbi:MAG: hypothetical protein WCS71_07340 [Sphaerochaetaceae bacterium]